MEKNNWIKNCLGYTNNKYETPSGNGKAIAQYKFDEQEHKMIPLKNKDNKPKTHNLYRDIQAQKSSTDYKKLIENENFDLEAVNFILNSQNPKYEYEKAIDYTNFGGIDTLKSMENKIVNTFGSLENFNQYCNKKFAKFRFQVKEQNKLDKKLQAKKEAKKDKEIEEFNEWKKNNKK